MDITPALDTEAHYISSYGVQGVNIRNTYYTTPLYITASQITPISLTLSESLHIDDFSFLEGQYSDMLLIGTGDSSFFIHPHLRQNLKKYTKSIDFMQNRNVCHAFNIALTEQRECAIILL